MSGLGSRGGRCSGSSVSPLSWYASWVVIGGLLAGCASAPPPSAPRFLVQVQAERFVMAVSDPETARKARANMAGQNRLHPSGDLVRGDSGFNIGHRWHLAPASVRMVEISAEVCDGLPSHVDRDVEHWVTVVKRYCPWSGRVVQEISPTGR